MSAARQARFAKQVFLVTRGTELIDRLESRGTCLVGELVELAAELHRTSRTQHLEQGLELYSLAKTVDDRIIWHNRRAVALLRPLADGSLAVLRFEPTGYPVPIDASESGVPA